MQFLDVCMSDKSEINNHHRRCNHRIVMIVAYRNRTMCRDTFLMLSGQHISVDDRKNCSERNRTLSLKAIVLKLIASFKTLWSLTRFFYY